MFSAHILARLQGCRRCSADTGAQRMVDYAQLQVVTCASASVSASVLVRHGFSLTFLSLHLYMLSFLTFTLFLCRSLSSVCGRSGIMKLIEYFRHEIWGLILRIEPGVQQHWVSCGLWGGCYVRSALQCGITVTHPPLPGIQAQGTHNYTLHAISRPISCNCLSLGCVRKSGSGGTSFKAICWVWTRTVI